MENRKIKNQSVSLLGMGCMRFPKVPNTEEIDIVKTEEMIDYAYNHGITYFDTAYPYHNGMSEIVLGNILKKYPRETFLLADKMPIWKCNSLDDAKNIFSEQLKKCQVDYFDFYLCHAMNLERFYRYKELDVFNFLLQMKKEGKIRYLGFSFHDPAQNIIPIANELDWDFAQIQFNYLDYEMQDAKLQYDVLTSKNISIVVMEPVRGGLLANVCDDAKELFINERPDSSIASWALRYVASFDNIKVILSGMTTIDQLKDNVNTFSNYEKLTDKEHEIIAQARKLILGNDFVPCTGCRYCMPCRFGVDIPKTFKIYNMYGINKNYEKFKEDMESIPLENQLNNCKKCRLCMKECPQNIDIPVQLEKIGKLLKK